jgi:DNA-directed RNA polymerase specialized sigma24 family protein
VGTPQAGRVTSLTVSPLHDALERHALVLLVFCVRRTFEVEAGLALWAETIAQSHLSARRLHTTGEAVAWLEAMAYRELARFRATGRPDGRALRRLGLCVPEPEPAELAAIDWLAGLPGLRARAAARPPALSERGREIVRLRVVEGQAAQTVADQMGITEDMVRARVSRGLRDAAQSPGAPPAADAIDMLPTLQAWLHAEPAASGRAARA